MLIMVFGAGCGFRVLNNFGFRLGDARAAAIGGDLSEKLPDIEAGR